MKHFLKKPNIVLIGMMGCGKTTVGRAISRKFNIPLIETDDMIKDRLNMTIPHIFEQYGESYFRNLETAVAGEAALYEAVVIATGGGIVLRPQNMALLKGFVVYLRCAAHLLYKRTLEDDERPLLNAAGEGRLNKIEALLAGRDYLYMKYSDFVLDAEEPVDKLAELIINKYGMV